MNVEMAVAAMQHPLPKVSEPLQMGSTRVKNPILMAALTFLDVKDGILGDQHVEYHRDQANGGCALFICGQEGAFPFAKNSFPRVTLA